MKRRELLAILACVATLSAAAAHAADALAPPAATAQPLAADETRAPRQAGGEPVVKRTVIEDGQARIEELRVRGKLQSITVAPKGRAPGYEVLTGDGFHATAEDPGTSRGSAGKRVWNVLRF